MQSNSSLLADVAKADALLAGDTLPDGQHCTDCWSAELAQALRSIGEAVDRAEDGAGWAGQITQGIPFGSRNTVLDATLVAYGRLAWKEGLLGGLEGAQGLVRSAQLPERVGRKHLTYVLLCLVQAHTTSHDAYLPEVGPRAT